MKKILIATLSIVFLLGACSQKEENSSKEETTKKSDNQDKKKKETEKNEKSDKEVKKKDSPNESEAKTEEQSTEEKTTEEPQSVEEVTTEQQTEQNVLTEEQPPLSEQQGGFDGSQPGWNYDENTGQFTDRDKNFESNIEKEEALFDQLENGDLSQEEYSNKMDELWDQ